MIPTSRVLDYVVEILKHVGRPMLVKDICGELRSRGVEIERPKLTQILWNQNSRPELTRYQETFKWYYNREAAEKTAEAKIRNPDVREQLSQEADILKVWEDLGFDFLGVWRNRTEKPFFFLREEGGEYLVVGPAGNPLRENSHKFSEPDSFRPSDFTKIQIKKAAEEFLKEQQQQYIERSKKIIRQLRDTESLAGEVYLGPPIIRIEDSIPASAVIFVGNVSALVPCQISMGWGTVLQPVYLVVNVLGWGAVSDRRHGVFKLCVYELLKRDLFVESDGYLNLTVNIGDDRVYIGSEKNHLDLSEKSTGVR